MLKHASRIEMEIELDLAETDLRLTLMRLARFTIITSFVVVLSLLALYVTHFARSDFSSDDAVLNMLAESIAQQGTLFPHDWVSNNGDLMLPSGALILAPLLVWFSNSFALHAVAGVCAIALMLLSFSGFLRAARLPIPIILLATAVLATGPSKVFAIMIFLQTTYVWLPAGFFLSATLIWRRFSASEAGRDSANVDVFALAMIVFLLVFANPVRAVLMLLLPLYAFDRTLALHSTRPESGLRRLLGIVGLNDAFVLIGLALPFLLATTLYYGLFHLGVVETVHNASRLYWDGPGSVSKHADIFLRNWLPSLGGGSEIFAYPGMPERWLRPLRSLFAAWLTWVGFAEVGRLRRNRNPLRSALTAAWLAAIVPILFIYIVYAPLAVDWTTMRYFTVPILLLLAMAAVRVSHASASWAKIAPAAGILMGIFLIAVSSVRYVPAATNPDMRFLQTRPSQPMRLAELLAVENLQWGYATWWNAGATTVFLNGKTRVSPVYLSDLGLTPFNYLIQRRWYQPESWSGETFLALSNSEASAQRLASLEMILGPATRKINSDDFTVLVYDWNIATNLSCDQTSVTHAPTGSSQTRGDLIAVKLGQKSPLSTEDVVGVLIRNRGTQVLSGLGEAPIAMRFEWLSGTESASKAVPTNILLPCAIHPGATRSFRVELPESPDGASSIRVSLSRRSSNTFQPLDGSIVEIPYRAGLPPRVFQAGFDKAGSIE